ncbi:prepilin-type N-terminal cleavage/methylation domain-containing protein [Candidatus Uhrbacteria bacterium]|nr:prepilin-type N-terminal cleavage/methylation domain-containing protein [Candidatus Uhrbacteria bacterium]
MAWLMFSNVNQKGQTLIESIIALALFSIVAVALISLMLGGASGSLEAGEYTHADAFAQEGIEAVRSIRDRAFNELRYASSGLSSAQNNWTFLGEGTSDSDAPFSRSITIAPVCRSALGDVAACPGTSTDVHSLYVTSAVSWKSSGGPDLVRSRSSYMTNWDSIAWLQTDWSGGSGQALWLDATRYDSDDGFVDRSAQGSLSLAALPPSGSWSLVSSPVDDYRLNGLSAVSSSDVWAVGESGNILHYNGTTWSQFTDVGSTEFYSVSMVSSSDGWAVGSSGKIYHYNGATWSQFTDVGSQNLNSVSMLSASYGWAVGGNGEIYLYNGTSWTSVASPVTQQLNAVQTLSTTDAWIGGDSGKFLHYNGSAWSEVTDLGGNNVETLSMISSSSGWAGGQNGEIYRYDGSAWSIFTDTGNEVWRAIVHVSSSDAWILGTGGALRRWNGSAWNTVVSPTQEQLRGIDMVSAQEGWGVGDEGTIIRFVGGPSGYVQDGSLLSSAFSTSDASPVGIIEWDGTIPACAPSCTVRLQLRTAQDAGGVPGVYTGWYGADGAGSYFTDGPSARVPIELNGNQWVQYRVELHGDGTQTPVLREVRVYYK